MKQAALKTFAALAVAALCAGAVFVGYDYLQDDNDDAPSEMVADESTDAENAVETDTPTETTVAPPPRDPAAQARAYSYLAEIDLSLPAVESVVRAALSDDAVNPDVYVRLRDNNPDPSGRVAPECAAADEPFIVIDVVDFVVVDAIDLCTPEAPDCISIAQPSDPPVIVEDCDGEISRSLAIADALAELGVTLPMGEAEFISRAEAAGIYIDVVTRDGEPMAVAAIEALGPQMSVEVEDDMVVRVVSFEDYDPVQEVLVVIGARLPMDEAEFISRAENGGYSVRVAVRDGEDFLLTADYSDTRLNVEVVDGQVVKVIDIG
ncbi:MAG: hypothetical protein ACPGCX_02420 [Ilumatobacteraceae bacterium]